MVMIAELAVMLEVMVMAIITDKKVLKIITENKVIVALMKDPPVLGGFFMNGFGAVVDERNYLLKPHFFIEPYKPD